MGIVATIAIVVIGIVIYQNISINNRSKRILNIPQDIVAKQFLELSATHRRMALEFAWSPIHAYSLGVPASSVLAKMSVTADLVIGWICVAVGAILLLLALGANQNEIPQFITFSIVMFGSGWYLIRLYKHNLILLKEIVAEDVRRITSVNALRKVAVNYICEQAPSWMEQAKLECLPLAKTEFNITPMHSFAVFSRSLQIMANTLPAPSVKVSFVFSNGLLSVVSGVVLDIKATSLSLASNENANVILSINPPHQWTHEEFHYKDVVQVGFFPGGGVDFEGASNPGDAVEGRLKLILSSGTEKTYPATKDGISTLQTVVRDRVRSAKEQDYNERPAPKEVNSSPAGNSKFCTNCGNGIGFSDRFCGGCGGQIGASI